MIDKIEFEDFITSKSWINFFLKKLFGKFNIGIEKENRVFFIVLSYILYFSSLVFLYIQKRKLFFISGILYFLSYIVNAVVYLNIRWDEKSKSVFLLQEKWKGIIGFLFLFYGILWKFRRVEIFNLFIFYLFLSNVIYFYNILMKIISKDTKSLTIYLPDFIRGRIKYFFSFILNNNLAFLPNGTDFDLLILTFIPIIGKPKIFFYTAIIFLFLDSTFRIYLFFINYLKIEKGLKRIVNITMRKNVRVYAALLGGGIGKRIGSEIPKQYLTVKEIPILIYTIQKFENSPIVNKVLLVVPKNWTAKTKELLEKYEIKKVYDVIPGDETRQLSSFKAIQYFETVLRDEDIVLIHDVVRPNVSLKLIEDCVNNVHECLGAIPVCKPKDTIVKENEKIRGTIQNILERESVYSVQTPQGFRFGIIKECHKKAFRENYVEATDDSSLLIRYGYQVKIFEGDPKNIKITDLTDLYLFEKLISDAK